MRQLFVVEGNRLTVGLYRRGARDFVILSAILAALLFTVPITQGVHAQGAGDGTIAEELDEVANCAEMLAVTNALSGGQSNTTVCGPANLFAVESEHFNEALEVIGEGTNLINYLPGIFPAVLVPANEGKIDVPTGAKPSPLFGALPFTMQMLREEEFGPVKLGNGAAPLTGPPPTGVLPTAGPIFPPPMGADSGPSETELDAFLANYISPAQDGTSVQGPTPASANPYPWPMEYANDPDDSDYLVEAGTQALENPWKQHIEEYIGRSLNTPPAEGRPPGQDWAHQRWEEFYPQAYFTTAQAGARINTGLRDGIQLHGYKTGEWGSRLAKTGQKAARQIQDVKPPSAKPIDGRFELINSEGRTVTDANFRGKWMLVFFGYTYCPEVL